MARKGTEETQGTTVVRGTAGVLYHVAYLDVQIKNFLTDTKGWREIVVGTAAPTWRAW